MTIRHLKIFLEVVDSGSMTQAGKNLYITQPSVSQAIKEIEDHYNIKLFDRLARKLYITDIGEEFLAYARHIISLYEDMEQQMGHSRRTSKLRIGGSLTIGTYLLSELSRDFMLQNQDIQIKAVIDNTRVLEEMVIKSQLDFALVEGPIHSEDLVARAFMEDELILISSPDHPLAGTRSIKLEDLAGEELVVRESGSGTRELFENTMLARGYATNIKWICNNPEAIKNAVKANIGMSVISKMAVEKEIKKGLLSTVPMEGLELKRKFNIIYHKNKYITGAMEEFLQVLA